MTYDEKNVKLRARVKHLQAAYYEADDERARLRAKMLEGKMTKALATFDELWPRTWPALDPDLKRIVCEIIAYQVLHATAEMADRERTLRAALEPFARKVNAESLFMALAHVTREDLRRAKEALK